MKLSNALASTDSARKLILLMAITIAGLVIIIIILAGKVDEEEIVVRMLPPIPSTEEMTIAGRNMSATYAENWAQFVASQLGNITPETAETVSTIVSRVMSQEVYEDIKDSISASIETMRLQGFQLRFRPEFSKYDREDDLVYVTGALTEIPVRGDPVTVQFTYEMKFRMRHGLPLITEFRAYEGKPGEPAEGERT